MHRRQLLMSAAALALPTLISVSGVATAQDTRQRRWRYFNRDRAYPSPERAKADAARVLREMGWPESAITQMVAAMRETGQSVRIVNGDTFDFMRTGRTGLWRNVLVAFEEPEVNGMEFTARAWYWRVVTAEGTFEVYLPEVCNNLMGRWTRIVESRVCAYVLFEARPGDSYAIVHVLGRNIRPDPHCAISASRTPVPNRGRDLTGVEYVPLADLVTGRCPTDMIPQFYGLPNHVVGSFYVTPGWWAVKVPVTLADNPDNRVVVCLVKEDGRSTHAMGVQHFEYRVHTTGRKVAIIWYSEEELPASYRGSTGLWWRWSSYRAMQCSRPRQS